MAELVYDVGMYKGDDTAHYLHEGFRVIAVEANPVLCDEVRTRFANEIGSGQLTVVNAAINGEPGRAQFWICDTELVWSSFDRENATRNGAKAHAIEVECQPFDELVGRYGKAHYTKIDIEGRDLMCLDQLVRLTPDKCPEFISIELGFGGAKEQLAALKRLGYTQFKIICQNFGWLNVSPLTMPVFGMRSHSFHMRCVRKAIHLSQYAKSLFGGYPLRFGSSGPIGSRTAGAWVSLEEAEMQAAQLINFDRELGSQGIGWWFDIHATGRR